MDPAITTQTEKKTEKEIRWMIYEKLDLALAEYKTGQKEKKFASNLRKASKLFAPGIAESAARERKKLQKQSAKNKKNIPGEPGEKKDSWKAAFLVNKSPSP